MLLFFLSVPVLAKQVQLSDVIGVKETDPIKELTIGIFPRRNARLTIKLFSPLANYLEQSLKIPVKLESAANYGAFNDRLNQRRYDLIHINQYHYANIHDKLKYDAIVQNEEFGEKTIKGAIYAHQDSEIKTISDLKGKSILFGGGRSAMMSYIVPTYLLINGGLKRGEYKEHFAVSPPNAVLATYLKQADAGAAGEVVRRLPIVKNKIDTKKLNLIAISDPLPHLPWALKRELNPELKQKITQLLIKMKTFDAGKSILKQARLSGFNPVSNSDYDVHRGIIQKVMSD